MLKCMKYVRLLLPFIFSWLICADVDQKSVAHDTSSVRLDCQMVAGMSLLMQIAINSLENFGRYVIELEAGVPSGVRSGTNPKILLGLAALLLAEPVYKILQEPAEERENIYNRLHAAASIFFFTMAVKNGINAYHLEPSPDVSMQRLYHETQVYVAGMLGVFLLVPLLVVFND